MAPALFTPFTIRGVTFKNRIMMSPMCQYSVDAEDGRPNTWHFVHYVSRAVGGAGLVMVEMTAVDPHGRITVNDLGLWDDAQIPAYARLAEAVHAQGARIGIQIAHAGRKAYSPGLHPVAPSAVAFPAPGYRVPEALSPAAIARIVEEFAAAARRAVAAGMDLIEIHGAHGYLLHEFLSPLSNRRDDAYGDPTRFPAEVTAAVKSVIPATMPLFMRVSAVDYDPAGYQLDGLVERLGPLVAAGVDLFDVSSGGNDPIGPETVYPGYQVPYARAVRQRWRVPVAAVGMLDDPALAEHVIAGGLADLVVIGRGFLRDPYWPNSAARALEGGVVQVPHQYHRAFPHAFLH